MPVITIRDGRCSFIVSSLRPGVPEKHYRQHIISMLECMLQHLGKNQIQRDIPPCWRGKRLLLGLVVILYQKCYLLSPDPAKVFQQHLQITIFRPLNIFPGNILFVCLISFKGYPYCASRGSFQSKATGVPRFLSSAVTRCHNSCLRSVIPRQRRVVLVRSGWQPASLSRE